MTTLHTAITTLVNDLQTKMSSDMPLTPEEQTLVATAIDKLSNHATLEKALVAVAEEHLTTATSTLQDAQTEMNAAKSVIEAQGANLTQIPQVTAQIDTSLAAFTQQNTRMIDNKLAGMMRPIFGIKHIEVPANSGNNRRSQAVFAVYDASGDSYLVRPSYTYGTNNYENQRFEYLKLLKSGNGKQTITTHYVRSNAFYATPTSYVHFNGCGATLPLATKTNPDDIAYDLVYSTQSKASDAVADFAGVYVKGAGRVSITKPKKNTDATDQWGIASHTSHTWHKIALLYDNQKHCLLVVDHDTSLLVEKYRDGNITTDISIADSAALQAYIDDRDVTTVYFIMYYMHWPELNDKFRTNLVDVDIGYYHDMFGFFGKLGDEVRMGTNQFSAHYIFTSAKQLQPLNYIVSSSVSHQTSYDAAHADINVALVDMQGEPLGIYHFHSKGDYPGYVAGQVAASIMCMNPYSHVGILNEDLAYNSTTAYYGIGRTCKAY